MSAKKVTTKTKTTTARFERAYTAASPSSRRAIEVAVVMLTEGASPELTTAVCLKLADMWQSDDGAEVGNDAR